MNKVYTLHDAIAKYVETGDCISFGGFTTNRKPYAAVAEILRQGQGDSSPDGEVARGRGTSPSGLVLPAATGT